jgi:FAD:protein FMN transferase
MRSPVEEAILVEMNFLAMGTHVTVAMAGRGTDALKARQAAEQVRETMVAFGRDFWAWGEGRLARLNRDLAAGFKVAIPHDMRELFALAWQYRQRTQARYEPRIGALVRLWGFHDQNELGTTPPASQDVAASLLALRRAPEYDGGSTYGPAPGVVWDFGAIGKGYIVDRCLAYLREQGFGNVLIDAGGNLATRGMRGTRPWRIGIRDPRSPVAAQQLLALLETGDEAVITHGDDQRSFEHQGKRYAHVLDPASGLPASGIRSLTVVHPDATRADAEGAALYVEGACGWRARALGLGLDQLMVVLDDGRVQVTRRLAMRLLLPEGLQVEVV